MSQDGERRRRCPKEHSGGVHLIASEVAAVREMFKRYSTGSTTLSQLAAWLNGSGLRTRNTKQLAGADGKLSPGPKLFTTASVRGILHNAFYSGLVSHRKQLRPGAHEPVVGQELFDLVQDKMRQNSGRSTTLSPHPERDYLLKGIIRCAYCKMPMWAQTYKSGRRYYREHRESRSNTQCPAHGGSIPCRLADEQVGRIVEAIELGPAWEEQLLSIISARDEVEVVQAKRRKVQERLRRLAKTYVDGVYDDQEYKRQKRNLEMELESLVVPKAAAAAEAGKLIERLPELWCWTPFTLTRKTPVRSSPSSPKLRSGQSSIWQPPVPAPAYLLRLVLTRNNRNVPSACSRPPSHSYGSVLSVPPAIAKHRPSLLFRTCYSTYAPKGGRLAS